MTETTTKEWDWTLTGWTIREVPGDGPMMFMRTANGQEGCVGAVEPPHKGGGLVLVIKTSALRHFAVPKSGDTVPGTNVGLSLCARTRLAHTVGAPWLVTVTEDGAEVTCQACMDAMHEVEWAYKQARKDHHGHPLVGIPVAPSAT